MQAGWLTEGRKEERERRRGSLKPGSAEEWSGRRAPKQGRPRSSKCQVKVKVRRAEEGGNLANPWNKQDGKQLWERPIARMDVAREAGATGLVVIIGVVGCCF